MADLIDKNKKLIRIMNKSIVLRIFIVIGIIFFVYKGECLFQLCFNNDKLIHKLFQPTYSLEWCTIENVSFDYDKDSGITFVTFQDTNTVFFMRIEKGISIWNEDEMISYKNPQTYMTMNLKNGKRARGFVFIPDRIDLQTRPYWTYDFTLGMKSNDDIKGCALTQDDYEIWDQFDMERMRFLEVMKTVKMQVIKQEGVFCLAALLVYGLILSFIHAESKGQRTL